MRQVHGAHSSLPPAHPSPVPHHFRLAFPANLNSNGVIVQRPTLFWGPVSMMKRPAGVQAGKVYLVGAGPGDPGMMTLRGAECLREADVVLYDYLVNSEILEHAPCHAELICLGRHGQGRIWSQEEIHAHLIAVARCGQTVVRLKGGDPAVFSRVAEEMEALADARIPFEVVPGVTAALAASSFAGIPVTHRELASAVALVTGHEEVGKETAGIDYPALAQFPGTIVMYMGVTTAPSWTSELMAAGKSPDTPVAVVRRCSWPDQTIVRCRLGDLVDRLNVPKKSRPPIIVIIGPVANLPSALSWFEGRPLFGTRILVTRPYERSDPLRQSLASLGAEVFVQPAIRVTPPDDWHTVDKVIGRLNEFDWLVFSSSNGVRFFLRRLFDLGRDLRSLGSTRLASIGPATAAELERYHLRCDLLPDEYRAESLAEALAEEARGKRFLLLRANRGREVLAERLCDAAGDVTQVIVYNSDDTEQPNDQIAALLASGEMDWVTVTSSAIARNLVSMFGDTLRNTRIGSISPVTSSTLRELQLEPAAEAREYTTAGLAAAIVSASD